MKAVKAMWIVLLLSAASLRAAPTMTTAIDVIDNWQAVGTSTLAVGASKTISDSYASVLYIEVALTSANAQGGCEVIIEVSYANDNWVKLTSFTGTAETPATTTLNDASATAGDTTITLTDATTGDFDVSGRKWFILDGTVANSESVKTKSYSGNTVTLVHDLIRSHANSLNVYDRVDEWVVSLPLGCAQVRTLVNNTDTDARVHFTTRISKVTAL